MFKNADLGTKAMQEKKETALLDVVSSAVKAWQRALMPILNRAAEEQARVGAAVSDLMEGLRPLFADLPEHTRRQFLNFSANGWHPDIEMPYAWLAQIADRFEREDPSADDLCVQYFESEAQRIEARLLSRWPKRTLALSEGFSAHHEGRHYLSIPVFLAQADGIAREGRIGRAYNPKWRSRPDSPPPSIAEAVQLPMRVETPLNQPERRRQGRDALNRHAVMHGDPPLDYGTRRNSLQALSYLNYVDSVIQFILDGASKESA